MKLKEILMPLLLGVAVLLASCGDNHSKVKEPDVVSVQIISLKMSSRDLPALAKTFFSIDHRQGVIYNATPLPYQSHIGKVKIEVKTPSTNTVQVFVGGEVKKQEADSVDFTDWEKGVQIKVEDKDKTIQKEYRLQIRCYDYDPLLFGWEKLGDALLPDPQGITRMSLSEWGDYVYLTYYFSDRTLLFRASKEVPTQWTPLAEADVVAQRIYALGESQAVLLDKEGSLQHFNQSANHFHSIALSFAEGYKVSQLMGVFTAPGDKGTTLSLIVTKGEEKRFAKVVIDPHTGKVLSQEVGYTVQKGFPDQYFDSKLQVVVNYPKLFVLGGETAPTAGSKMSMSLWSTTTALDWVTAPASATSVPLPPVDSDPCLVYDALLMRYYLYIPNGTEGYRVYYSTDGINWHTGSREIFLHAQGEEIGGKSHMVGYTLKDHRIVLLGGKDDKGNWLRTVWVGRPKIYEKN